MTSFVIIKGKKVSVHTQKYVSGLYVAIYDGKTKKFLEQFGVHSDEHSFHTDLKKKFKRWIPYPRNPITLRSSSFTGRHFRGKILTAKKEGVFTKIGYKIPKGRKIYHGYVPSADVFQNPSKNYPFKSKAQQRFMFARHPRIARRWAKVTRFRGLPERVRHNPITVWGSQSGTPLKKTNYEFIKRLPFGQIILLDKDTNVYEVWGRSPHHSGYRIQVGGGVDYEFLHEYKQNPLRFVRRAGEKKGSWYYRHGKAYSRWLKRPVGVTKRALRKIKNNPRIARRWAKVTRFRGLPERVRHNPITVWGSQSGTPLKKTNYEFIKRLPFGQIILLDKDTNVYEVWGRSPHYSGYRIQVGGGVDYEFLHEYKQNPLRFVRRAGEKKGSWFYRRRVRKNPRKMFTARQAFSKGYTWDEIKALELRDKGMSYNEIVSEIAQLRGGVAINNICDRLKRIEFILKKNPLKRNPAYRKPVEIYNDILKIEAVKGRKSHWANQPFTHSFGRNTKAKILGMPDGSLRIKGKKRLWALKRYN